jgi:transposase-like protein
METKTTYCLYCSKHKQTGKLVARADGIRRFKCDSCISKIKKGKP